MAQLVPAPKWRFFKDDNTPAANYVVKTYTVGGPVTGKNTYTNSSASVPNGSQVTLNARGEADIWWDGLYYIEIYKSAAEGGALVLAVDNYGGSSSSSTTSSNGNLISNGSFEDGTDGSGFPLSWSTTTYTGSSVTVDTASVDHGSHSLKCVSVGSGGGSLTSNDYVAISDGELFAYEFHMNSSIATVRNVVQALYYDKNKTLLSTVSLYDASSGNPTSWTRFFGITAPPATACFLRMKVIGADASGAAGTTWFDGINVLNAATPSCLYRSGATTSITNSTTETTLFTYTVPANIFATTRCLRARFPLQAINTTGAPVNLTIRVKFGATTIFSSIPSIVNDANGNRFDLEVCVNAKNATNAQVASVRLASHSATGDGTSGVVTEASSTYMTLAADTTVGNALAVTAQWASASASATAYCHNSTVEVI